MPLSSLFCSDTSSWMVWLAKRSADTFCDKSSVSLLLSSSRACCMEELALPSREEVELAAPPRPAPKEPPNRLLRCVALLTESGCSSALAPALDDM